MQQLAIPTPELLRELREMNRQWREQGRRLDKPGRLPGNKTTAPAPIVNVVQVTDSTPDAYGYPASVLLFDGTTWNETYTGVRAVKTGGGDLLDGDCGNGRLVRVADGYHIYAITPARETPYWFTFVSALIPDSSIVLDTEGDTGEVLSVTSTGTYWFTFNMWAELTSDIQGGLELDWIIYNNGGVVNSSPDGLCHGKCDVDDGSGSYRAPYRFTWSQPIHISNAADLDVLIYYKVRDMGLGATTSSLVFGGSGSYASYISYHKLVDLAGNGPGISVSDLPLELDTLGGITGTFGA